MIWVFWEEEQKTLSYQEHRYLLDSEWPGIFDAIYAQVVAMFVYSEGRKLCKLTCVVWPVHSFITFVVAVELESKIVCMYRICTEQNIQLVIYKKA